MYLSINRRRCRDLCLLIFLLTSSACTLRVEKIKPFGINDQHFEFSSGIARWQDSVLIICCNGKVSTPSATLEKGSYVVQVQASGSQAAQMFPLLKVRLNDKVLQEVRLDSGCRTYRIPFILSEKERIRIQMVFDDDAVDLKGNDRNIMIRQLLVLPSGQAGGSGKRD